jgi:hypothetical protein
MKIRFIFGSEDCPDEGLWAIILAKSGLDEFRKLFTDWADSDYMYQFCLDHLSDVQMKFGYEIDPLTAADELMEEAEELKALLFSLAEGQKQGENLQHVFKPLNNEGALTELQLSKASAKGRMFNNPKLRIYAVRVGENTYVVSGGVIKLTDKMKVREHTKEQWERIQMLRDWLKSENVSYPEDLKSLL